MPKSAVPGDFVHGDRVLLDGKCGAEVVSHGRTLVQVELEDRDHRHIAVTPDHLTLAER